MKKEISRLEETSYLSPYSKGQDVYTEQRKKLIKLMECRGSVSASMTEESIGMYHLDVFGHVSGPSLAALIHGALDRHGSWTFERVLGIHDAQGPCTGRGPLTVLPRQTIQTYRVPVTWPDAVIIGVRSLPLDDKSGQFGTVYELYSLKTGQLCFKQTIYQSLIDVTKGGNAIHPDVLAEKEEKWKHWKEWFNNEAIKAEKLYLEAEAKLVKKRSTEIDKQKNSLKTRQAKL